MLIMKMVMMIMVMVMMIMVRIKMINDDKGRGMMMRDGDERWWVMMHGDG